MCRRRLGRLISLCLIVTLFLFNSAYAAMFTAGSFNVNPKGAATYAIPIQVTPGTADIEPKLALTYNSKGGNGLLGVGWSLSGLSTIVRCPKTVAQDGEKAGVTYTMTDQFCLDGQRLIAVNGTYGENGTEYRTELDTFVKIVSYTASVCKTNSGETWSSTFCVGDTFSFKVWTKSGQIMEYGTTADSRIEAYDGGTVRVWALNKVQDIKGNYLTITYTEDRTNGDFYPNRIDYTGNTNTSTAPNNSVQFQYEARPDVTPLYEGTITSKSSLKINNVVRLSRMQTYTGTTLVKDYRLQYGVSPQTSRSVLNSITECEGATGTCLPPTSFSWTYQGNNFSSARWETQAGLFWDAQQWFSVDVNGDGRTDLVNAFAENGLVTIDVHVSTGSGFQIQRWITQTGTYTASQHLFVADVNGDGKADLVNVYNDGGSATTNVYLSTGTGFQMQRWETKAGGYWDSQKWFVGDVNGDGRADLINVFNDGGYSTIDVHLNTGTGYQIQRWETKGSAMADSDKWFVGDADGDGKADLIQITNDSGAATSRVHFSSAGAFRSYIWESRAGGMWDGQQWFVADVNGDGRADLINVFDEGGVVTVDVHISTGGGFRIQRWETKGGTFKNGQRLFVTDVNGDGRLDLVNVFNDNGLASIDVHKNTGSAFASQRWETQSGGYWDGQKWFIADAKGEGNGHPVNVFGDFGKISIDSHNVAAPGDRIVTFTNGIGSAISVTYQPLTRSTVYTADTGSAYPVADLQVPLYVVSSVASPNGNGGTVTTNYTYGGLKRDWTGRGLLGFRWMQAQQAETGIADFTEYRQDWPYVGMPSQQKRTLAGSGNSGVLAKVVNTYGCTDFVSASGCTVAAGRRYFPFVSQRIASGWDLNGAVLPVVTTTTQYDSYGNPTQIDASATGGFSKTIVNTYTNDSTKWIIGRLTNSTVTSTTP